MESIAIVGTGISGLVCAYLLGKKYRVTLYEQNDYLGGHTFTHCFEYNQKHYAIDAGFIVFNQKTYPHFCKILQKEHIPVQETQMSFSFHDQITGFEYNGHSLKSLFGQKSNLLRPSFYRMIFDILRFNQDAKRKMQQGHFEDKTLADYLNVSSYGVLFKHAYLYPMTQAIWSSPHYAVETFSCKFLFEFFLNHGLLDIINRPPWYVIQGGSASYIPTLTQYCNDIRLSNCVQLIERQSSGVTVHTDSSHQRYEKVIIATHSDQALRLLADPSPLEQKLLSAIMYQPNDICIHTDASLMPKNKSCWASWNFRKKQDGLCQLTYYMNLLQGIKSPVNFFVSVNQTEDIDPSKQIKCIKMAHPVFTLPALHAQQALHQLNNFKHTFYCGAYFKNGFHEDGVKSAIDVCNLLGVNA